MKSKIVIIGAGSVGTTIAYALMIQGIVRNIVLIDIDLKKAKGESLDLNHGRSLVLPVDIHAGDYSECKDADIIIITAGAKQKPNETRIDLLQRNIKILKSIISEIKKNVLSEKLPILLVVSNPCDILTYFALKFSGFPKEKVIGSGTYLDTARLRYEISNHCNIAAHNIHAYVVGEHGDSEVILWSNTRVGLQLFTNFCRNCEKHCMNNVDMQWENNIKHLIEENVKNAAYKIIESKGYTNFGVGLAVSQISNAILRDQNSIIPVSTFLDGHYSENNVVLSVPCILNSNGVRNIVQLDMTDYESHQFHESAEKIRSIILNISNNE